MDVSLILKIAGIGLLLMVLCQILSKSGRDDQAMLLSIGGMILVLLLLVEEMGTLLDTVRSVFGF